MSKSAFKPLTDREPISNVIVSQIEKAILSKRYQPGEKLPSELEFCKLFGVSRTSVREALQKLTARGMITVIKGKGIFVNDFSSKTVTDPLHYYLQLRLERDYVMDLVHSRQIIEPAIAYSAALNRTDSDIEKLRGDVEKLSGCNNGYKELAGVDSSFHLDLAKSTQNSIIPLILEPIHKLMPDVKSYVYATINEAKESALIWHNKILQCIIEGDAEKARASMVEHLLIAEEHSERMLAAHQNKKNSAK